MAVSISFAIASFPTIPTNMKKTVGFLQGRLKSGQKLKS